jgi:hypothetical protein
LSIGTFGEEIKNDKPSGEERHSDDPRWQLLAILKERSGIREVMNS